ncbi:MAG: hypothetical protein ACI8WB_003776, partial [Phenylobacterium sp.]
VMERKISVLRSACLDFVSEQGIVARKIGAYRIYATV